jgi:hypothetical protein
MDQHQAQLVSHLADHPSWGALRTLATEKRKAKLDSLAKKLAREDIPSADLQFMRGFLAGMDALLDAPNQLLKQLDKIGELD